MSWVSDLDALASAGVINFDAPAYIKGTPPRYYGNPDLEIISPNLPQMKTQPESDVFNNTTPVQNPSWKKWLFGGLVTAGLVFGGFKLKNKILPALKKLFKSKKVMLPIGKNPPFAAQKVKFNPKKLKYNI